MAEHTPISEEDGMELNDIPKDSQDVFTVALRCADCGDELNRSHKMTGEELHRAWITMAINSGFNAGQCKNGCRSTWSDLNINTSMVIEKLPTAEELGQP